MADAKNRTGQDAGGQTLKITWVKSAIGQKQDQKDAIRSLGFTRLNQTLELRDNPALRGQIFKVKHLVRVEEDRD